MKFTFENKHENPIWIIRTRPTVAKKSCNSEKHSQCRRSTNRKVRLINKRARAIIQFVVCRTNIQNMRYTVSKKGVPKFGPGPSRNIDLGKYLYSSELSATSSKLSSEVVCCDFRSDAIRLSIRLSPLFFPLALSPMPFNHQHLPYVNQQHAQGVSCRIRV